MQVPISIDANPFAVLSFLAAPALLTNASALLALSTSNRLARASDRARHAATVVLESKNPDDPAVRLSRKDFEIASLRAKLLVEALRFIYLAGGCFAAGTCVALLGAFAGYFRVPIAVLVTEVATVVAAVAGIAGLVRAAVGLTRETRFALQMVQEHHAAISRKNAEFRLGPTP